MRKHEGELCQLAAFLDLRFEIDSLIRHLDYKHERKPIMDPYFTLIADILLAIIKSVISLIKIVYNHLRPTLTLFSFLFAPQAVRY